MTDRSTRDTVTELLVETTLRVDVPVDRGDELAAGAQDVLESAAAVRYADVAEIRNVDAALAAGSAAVRRALLEDDRVLGLERFDVVDGPYRIESW